jgi:hypothetical protein
MAQNGKRVGRNRKSEFNYAHSETLAHIYFNVVMMFIDTITNKKFIYIL